MKLNQICRFGITAASIGATTIALMTIAAPRTIAMPSHDPKMPEHPPKTMPEMGKTMESGHGAGSGHGHRTVTVPAGQPKPSAQLIITPDPMKGWNMQIQTTNFTFAPEQIGRRSQPSEGHAHLYLNGKKIARVYGPWSHIPSLPAGKNTLRVTLNTNNHEDLSVDGKVVEAIAIIEVPTAPPTVQPATTTVPNPPTSHQH